MSAIVGCIVAVAAVFALTNAAVVLMARDKIVSAEEAASFGAEAIVVLGASVYADGTPSGVLQDRLDDGIALYFAGVAPVIVMSGDNGTETYTEVDAMSDYAIAQGVPADAIVRDEEGFSTYESMWRAHNVFGYDRIVVATQTYHLYRAIYVAQGLGMEALGVASDYHDYQNQTRFDARDPRAHEGLLPDAVQGAAVLRCRRRRRGGRDRGEPDGPLGAPRPHAATARTP